MIPILTAASLRLAHTVPVGGPITTATVSLPIYERFQPIQPVPILLLPIPADPPGCLAEDTAGQMLHPYPRQNGHIRQEF